MALTIYKKGFKMGKVEILTLIAGVVLSIALALIVVPMFGGASDMSKKTQIKYEVISLINHKDLWEMDKTLDPTLDFNKSYKNHTKDVKEVGGYTEFQSQNQCKVDKDLVNVGFYKIDCKIYSKNKPDSYVDLIEDLKQTGSDKKFFFSGSGTPITIGDL